MNLYKMNLRHRIFIIQYTWYSHCMSTYEKAPLKIHKVLKYFLVI